MKKFLSALISVITLWLVPSALATDATSLIDYSALERYTESWNNALANYDMPMSFFCSDDDGFISLAGSCYSSTPQSTGIMESLTAPIASANLLVQYLSFNDSVSMIYGSDSITEVPKTVEVYANGINCGGTVGFYPADEEDENELYTLEFSMENMFAILNADDAFMRLVTDKSTYFQEMNSDEMPATYLLWCIIADGINYSTITSDRYLDPEMLANQTEANDNVPALPVAASIPFQTNYEAIDQAAQSVFLLEVYDESNHLVATGSGFVAFDQGTLITNEHVIQDAAYIIAHSDQYRASYKLTKLKAISQSKDIAILEFDKSAKVVPLTIDIDSRLLRGQPVTAIGSPKGVINTVSSGNISNIVYYSAEIPDYIQFTAPISPGSSGGALFNENGAVVGLCVSYLKEGESMYYAIPMKYVYEMYADARNRDTITLAQYNDLPSHLPAAVLQNAQLGDNCIELKWSAVPHAETYEIFRRSEHETEFTCIASSQENLFFDADVIIGQTYEYYVHATHSWCTADPSNKVSFTMIEPTPSPTPKPTPVPTATPIPQGKVMYKVGDNSEDILNIKFRLYELGYFISTATFDNDYNDTLKGAVKSFQEMHNLLQTGVIDDYTYEMLFSIDALQKESPAVVNSLASILGFSVDNTFEKTNQFSKKIYQLNESSDEVLCIKQQLKDLGYYRSNVDLDGNYNKMLVERVKMFQKNNKLEQTGTVDYVTLIRLFSPIAEKGQWYVKPTPTPKPEKGVMLEIPDGSYGEWNNLGGNRLKFRLQVKNTSASKTVVAYELYFYTKDTWGRRLIPEDEVYILSVESTLKPGQKKYSTYVTLNDRDKIDEVYVAVHKVKYSDGTIATVPLHDYSFWTID